MAYELKIWNANKSVLLNTITDETPGGLSDGFKWQLTPTGDTVQLEASGRNDRLRLHPRAVVQLRVDDEPAFYGVVPDPDSLNSQEVTSFQVLGGREVLLRTLMDGATFRDMGVYAIARSIFSRLCPPALTYDPTQIGDGSGTDAGPVLSTYYAPTSTLDEVLTALARAAGVAGGVDNQGRIFLGRPTLPPLAVAYSSQPWRRLRVQGRETVTQAILRVVSAPGEGALSARTGVNESFGLPYLPATISVTATAPEHALYGASRSIAAPEGISLTRNSYAGELVFNEMDGAPATDGDPDTGTTTTGPTPGILIRNTTERVIGLRLRYRYEPTDGLVGVVWIQHATFHPEGGSAFESTVAFGLPESGGTREMVFIAPPSAEVVTNGWDISQVQVYVITPDGAGTAPVNLVIYDMAQIVVDEVAALRLAESYLQVPPTSPAEVSLPALVPPRPEVTITASPDGDVTGSTNLWEYVHQSGQLHSTLIRLGSDGQSDVGRAIKFAVRGA
ncbi:hypothetical protein [Deinococcus aquaticus]|uniref:hypothetical protein n=1 Tax=Deinococcus aquaticus TaxID=328692 RepID=UPI003F44C601